MKWHMMKGRRIWHVESLTVEYRYEALPVEIKNKSLFSYASLITCGRHYKLRGKIDDLTVIFNGISISTQPFLMKMYKKRKFNKNMGIFQHLTRSFEVRHSDPCHLSLQGLTERLKTCRQHVATQSAFPLVSVSY